jgi:hypothetical protein
MFATVFDVAACRQTDCMPPDTQEHLMDLQITDYELQELNVNENERRPKHFETTYKCIRWQAHLVMAYVFDQGYITEVDGSNAVWSSIGPPPPPPPEQILNGELKGSVVVIIGLCNKYREKLLKTFTNVIYVGESPEPLKPKVWGTCDIVINAGMVEGFNLWKLNASEKVGSCLQLSSVLFFTEFLNACSPSFSSLTANRSCVCRSTTTLSSQSLPSP